MRKEFVLLLFGFALLFLFFTHLPKYIKEWKERSTFRAYFKQHFLFQFLLLFGITTLIFFLLAVGIQHVGLSTFILSFKYDLFPFFIFGLGISMGLLCFTEQDKDLFSFYKKLMIRCLRGGLVRWLLIYIMPNALKFFGYDRHSYEGTLGARPPAAYYTLINKGYVRNQFLFERPISFGFRLIAFFPFFVLGFLRKKNIKSQILYTL
jgi:hypothetical protein